MANPHQEHELEIVAECVQRRQQHPRKAKPMNNLVAQVIAQTGVGQTQTRQKLRSAWEIAAGKLIAGVTTPGKLKRGSLEIIVESSAVMQQLTFKKEQLLAAIRHRYADSEIKDLRFKVGVVKRNEKKP